MSSIAEPYHGVPLHLQCPLFPSVLHSILKNFAFTAIGKGKRVQKAENHSNLNAFLSDKLHLLKGWAKGCVLDGGGKQGQETGALWHWDIGLKRTIYKSSGKWPPGMAHLSITRRQRAAAQWAQVGISTFPL